MPKTKAQIQSEYAKRTNYQANKKYDKENTKRYAFKLNLKTDKDVIAKLDIVPNKTDYIRQLILKDISATKKED